MDKSTIASLFSSVDKTDGTIASTSNENNADVTDKKETNSKTDLKQHVEPKDEIMNYDDLRVYHW